MKKVAKYKQADVPANPDLECPMCKRETQPGNTRLAQLTKLGENNFYFGKRNYLKEARKGTFQDWACRNCEENGSVIFPNFKKQEYGLGVPIYLYHDKKYLCQTCDASFVFKATEQQHWYEELRFNYNSYPKNCLDCRKKIRQPKILQKRLSELLKTEPKNSEILQEIAVVYEKLGLEYKSRIFHSRSKNTKR